MYFGRAFISKTFHVTRVHMPNKENNIENTWLHVSMLSACYWLTLWPLHSVDWSVRFTFVLCHPSTIITGKAESIKQTSSTLCVCVSVGSFPFILIFIYTGAIHWYKIHWYHTFYLCLRVLNTNETLNLIFAWLGIGRFYDLNLHRTDSKLETDMFMQILERNLNANFA